MFYYRLMAVVAMLVTHSIIAQNLFPKQLNGRFGYIDTLNQWVIPAQFEQAGFYTQKKAIASRKDSLFLVINKDMILYLPDLKNYKELNAGHFAIQHKNGRWAIADSSFTPLTGFNYTKISYTDSSMYMVWKNLLAGLVDLKYREVFPCTFLSIERLGNGQFKAKSAVMESIYAYRDSTMVLVMRDVSLKYSPLHPMIYQSMNKSQTRLVVFNLKGDSIYACNKCMVSRSFGDYIFVQHKDGVKMLDAGTGEIKKNLRDMSGVMIETRSPAFLYLRSEKEMYLAGQEQAVFSIGDSVNMVAYVNGKYLFVNRSTRWGVYDYKGNKIIPCRYERLGLVNDSLVEAIGRFNKDLYHMPHGKKVMTVMPGTYLSVDETSILAYNETGPSKLYEINSELDLTDSAEFKSIQIINAGKKTTTISTDGMMAANGNNLVNVNTSISERWYFHRDHFGLLGFNNDTLIRPRFVSVYALNDSLDIVTTRSAAARMRYIAGAGVCNANFLYAIVNNRTAKYVLYPRYHFIDTKQFVDTSLSVVRVLTRAGNFALMHKNDYSLVEGTECAYITEEQNGYMRLFYQAKFFSSANHAEKKTNKIPQFLTTIDQFWKYGFNEIRGISRMVYVVCNAVNIADKKGTLQWDQANAAKLGYVDECRHDNFISVDHKNRFGVMSAKKVLIPNQYGYISRLTRDDRYFVLQSNNLKYGYVNEQGVELSEAIFNNVYDFRDEYAWCKRGDSMVLITKAGDIIETGLPKLQVSDVSEGYTSYRVSKGWFLMDVEGNQVGTKLFKKLRPFLNGAAAAAMQGNNWGLINNNGDWILKPGFEAFQCETPDVVVFNNNNHYHFYNRQGVFLQKIKAKGSLKPLGNHYFVMEQNGLTKIFHENGEPFRKRKYKQDIRSVDDTVITVANSNIVMYNAAGKKIKRYRHQGGVRAIDKGILKFERNKQRETTVTLMIAESQRQLHRDVYDDSVKYINLVKPVLNFPAKLMNFRMDECFKYNAFIYEYEAFARKMYCLSDSLGNLLSEQVFSVLQYYGNGLFKASYMNQNGIMVTGVLNHYGLWVVEPKFNEIKPFHSGVAIYSKRSDFWIADGSGALITDDVLVDYTYQGGYYCLKTEDKMAWWHPQKGWLTGFSK